MLCRSMIVSCGATASAVAIQPNLRTAGLVAITGGESRVWWQSCCCPLALSLFPLFPLLIPLLVTPLYTCPGCLSPVAAICRHGFPGCRVNVALADSRAGLPTGLEPLISSPNSTSLGILPFSIWLMWPRHLRRC